MDEQRQERGRERERKRGEEDPLVGRSSSGSHAAGRRKHASQTDVKFPVPSQLPAPSSHEVEITFQLRHADALGRCFAQDYSYSDLARCCRRVNRRRCRLL
jgi:hypothetical protein